MREGASAAGIHNLGGIPPLLEGYGALLLGHELAADLRRLFGLQTVLARHNGKTRYFIHACRNSRWDMLRAKHLKACPGVMVIGYPCAGHGVASTLARNGLLGGLLKLENQAQMGRRIREAISRGG